MADRTSFPLALTLFAGLLGGCAANLGDYPSLARRDTERLHGTIPVVPAETPVTPAPVAPSAELAARLERLIGQAEAAQSRFAAHEPRARALAQAAAGSSLGSDRWSVAAIAFAELESARSDAMIALAELDLLYAGATVEGGAVAAVLSARDRVTRLVADQDRVLADLRGS